MFPDIAVIGIAFNFPGADSIDSLWNIFKSGSRQIGSLPFQRTLDLMQYQMLSKVPEINCKKIIASFLDRIDLFDYQSYGLTRQEALTMDPNHRLFLESAHNALRDAGYHSGMSELNKTGVFVGFGEGHSYATILKHVGADMTPITNTGNLDAFVSARIAYYLNLQGPNMTLNTTCSSSLVAIHQACLSLNSDECTMAVAGGIQLHPLPIKEIFFGIESLDGITRPFDNEGSGTGTGEGVGVVVLKSYERAVKDGNRIYAVIKGSAVNYDGKTMGITAPNPVAQSHVILKAWSAAGVDPEQIGYIEMHGTGTTVGDPIEIEGLQQAFSKYTDKKQFCAIGSAKANFGHLDYAAGILGFTRLLIALYMKKIPPLAGFKGPNRFIPFIQSPVYICTKLKDWAATEGKRTGGVSSFGMSGTNCHMVLQESLLQGSSPAASTWRTNPVRCWIGDEHTGNLLSQVVHKTVWSVIESGITDVIPAQKQSCIVLIDRGTRTKALVACLNATVESAHIIMIGDDYKRINESTYEIGPSEEQMQSLFKDLPVKAYHNIYCIFTDPCKIENKLVEELNRRTSILLFFLRELMNQHTRKERHLTLITQNAVKVDENDILQTMWACLSGIIQVVSQEYPLLRPRYIDIDEYSDDILFTEQFPETTGFHIAIRNRKILDMNIVPYTSPLPSASPMIRKHGVYIILGGFGGIGFQIARYIRRYRSTKLILISRRQIPERHLWDTASAQEEYNEAIKSIQELEAGGQVVEWYAADITDNINLVKILSEIKTCHGNIHGIIHCAGEVGSGLIIANRPEIFIDKMRAKIACNIYLYQFLQNESLDFYFLTSSIAGFYGGVGQADYTMANIFMATIAEQMRTCGIPAFCIYWSSWNNVGMDRRVASHEDSQHIPLNLYECFYILETVWRIQKSGYIGARFRDKAVYEKKAVQEIPLLDLSSYTYDEVLCNILSICHSLFGNERIQKSDNFFTIGGNSFLALEACRQINKLYNNMLSVSDFYATASIEELSKYLFSLLHPHTEMEIAAQNRSDKWEEQLDMIDSQFRIK